MDGSGGLAFLKTHGTDIAIGVFAICAVVGPSTWIIAAGLVAGCNLALRRTRGGLMTVGGRLS